MARTRSIKPGFFDNDILGDLPPLTRLLFIGLWCIADREGRLEDRPRRIKKALLGYDDVDSDGVDVMLQALHDNGFIYRYTIEDEHYIQVVNFSKHQNPHIKEKASEIPPPPYDCTSEETYGGAKNESTVQAPDLHQISTEEATLVPYYRLPSTGTLSPTMGNPQGGDGLGTEQNEPQPGESLTVETADGTGNEKPAHHSTTLAEKRFEEFWAAYPKKVGKKAAEAAWKKIKPDTALHDRIMTAIGRARVTEQWQRENGRYIPNPATWLNQGRWDDEYEEVKTYGTGINQQHIEPNGAESFVLSGFKPADEE